MGSKLHRLQVVNAAEASELDLPERVEVALKEIVGAAKEGLLALSVGVGLAVLAELMEEEVTEAVGTAALLVERRPARLARGSREGEDQGVPPPLARPETHLRELAHLARRADVVFVSRQLGHASPDITLRIYSHLFDAERHTDRFRELLDGVLGAAVSGNARVTTDGSGRKSVPAEVAQLSALRR